MRNAFLYVAVALMLMLGIGPALADYDHLQAGHYTAGSGVDNSTTDFEVLEGGDIEDEDGRTWVLEYYFYGEMELGWKYVWYDEDGEMLDTVYFHRDPDTQDVTYETTDGDNGTVVDQ